MSGNIPVDEVLQRIRNTSSDAASVLAALEQRIQSLESQKADALARATAAEADRELVESRLAESQERLRKTNDLRDGQYQQLIADIFERPKRELISGIRWEGKLAIIVSLLVTAVSVWISILASNRSAHESNAAIQASSEKIFAGLNDSKGALVAQVDSLELVVGELRSAVALMQTNEQLRRMMVAAINRDATELGGLRTKNDVALVYKMRLAPRFAPALHDVYYAALQDANIPSSVLPEEVSELARWDNEMLQLHSKALVVIADKAGAQIGLTRSDAQFAPYKAPRDRTDYGLWAWSGELRYLPFNFRSDSGKFARQIALNAARSHIERRSDR